MNPENLAGGLEPISTCCRDLIADGEFYEQFSGHSSIGRRPKVGTEAYAVTLYEPLPDTAIARYEELHEMSIPGLYRDLLENMNGASIFNLSLYGLPPSMAQDPPLLDRSGAQPLDLATANRYWRHEFSSAEGSFHFGGSFLSLEENVGYFLETDGEIASYRKGGERVSHWSSLQEFLGAEILRSKELFPAFEAMMADLCSQ